MTPLALQMLIHFHVSMAPFENYDLAPQRQALADHLAAELIFPLPEPGCYRTTERGSAHVQLLCMMPFPQATWSFSTGGLPVLRTECLEHGR